MPAKDLIKCLHVVIEHCGWPATIHKVEATSAGCAIIASAARAAFGDKTRYEFRVPGVVHSSRTYVGV